MTKQWTTLLSSWDTQQQLYISLLDGVRYLVVWQPIIFGAVQAAYYILGLK